MVNQAERALAGDTEAQRQIVADYEQVDPAAAHGLSANLQFDAETDALVARGLAGDPAALEEAVARVARVRGYWPAEELRASFGQAHDQETVADDHDTTDRDHVNDGAGNV
jgi:hypothetical protein